jgi:hypothetical protein
MDTADGLAVIKAQFDLVQSMITGLHHHNQTILQNNADLRILLHKVEESVSQSKPLLPQISAILERINNFKDRELTLTDRILNLLIQFEQGCTLCSGTLRPQSPSMEHRGRCEADVP